MIRNYKTVAGLLKDPKRWIKGDMARTSKRGPFVPTTHPEAQCFCLAGAVYRVYSARGGETAGARAAFRKLTKAILELFPAHGDTESVVNFNNHRRIRHADVTKVVRRAKV